MPILAQIVINYSWYQEIFNVFQGSARARQEMFLAFLPFSCVKNISLLLIFLIIKNIKTHSQLMGRNKHSPSADVARGQSLLTPDVFQILGTTLLSHK